MGICSSCESSCVATAKLIFNDGRLLEFPSPVKVSHLLRKYPAFFICNSDDMDFDDVVSAIREDDELQLGQLYFALPLDRLHRRLMGEEMAALAVKASLALNKSCGDRCGRCRANILVFPDDNGVNAPSRKLAAGGGNAVVYGSRRHSGGGRNGGGSGGGGSRRRRRTYSGSLDSIPELELDLE